MIHRTVTENLASAILARSGIGVIWRLHLAAADVSQIGNATAAAAILEIADAAEEALLRANEATELGISWRRGKPQKDRAKWEPNSSPT
jgi:hypothetical protein